MTPQDSVVSKCHIGKIKIILRNLLSETCTSRFLSWVTARTAGNQLTWSLTMTQQHVPSFLSSENTSIDFIKLIFINIYIYALYRRRNVSSRLISNCWWNNTNVMAMGWFWFVFWQQYNSRLTIKKFSFLKQWWCSSSGYVLIEGHI